LPESVKSTCSYCGVGCGVTVQRLEGGRLRLAGDADHPVNRGMLCSKGRYLHTTVMDRGERLLHPEMRGNRQAPLQRVSWTAAMRRAAAVFRSLIARYGPRSVGMYVSGQMLTEEYYVANKLVKGFWGCNNIDTNSRLCMSTAVAAYKLSLGDDLVPISYEDIEHSDCMLIAGANPAWCHPVLFRRIERRKQENPETRIIVVDPRRTESCELADLHLQIQPGSDTLLYHAIARCLIENGWIDRPFIDAHTEGFEALRARAMAIDLEDAAARCRVPTAQIQRAARMIAHANGFLTLWAMGLNQSRVGVDKNLALINLNLLTGQIGRPGAGPFSLTGQPNAMGGREVGGMATLLAAHHDLDNPDHRRKIADFWGAPTLDPEPGLMATEMFEALEDDRLKAIWIVCTNPAVSLPNLNRVERALKKARFVVVQDISRRTDTAAFADLLLPAAGWLEKEGTMTNSERRVGYLPRLVDPPGEALPDAEILCRFAREMGFGDRFDYPDAAAIFDEFARQTSGTPIDMSGLSHRRLRAEGPIQWPCPASDHPGTPRLFEDRRFATESGRARLHPVAPSDETARIDPDHPYILTTGRVRDQWHTMTRTGLVGRLKQHVSQPLLEIHPDDAARLGIVNGQAIEVASAHGAIRSRARLAGTIKPGVVFMPMHWGKRLGGGVARANNATSGEKDPVSGEPDFKFTAVALRPIEQPAQRVAVIGAGAASLAFVRRYRELNQHDRLAVFSGEPEPYYNRVLLPELIAGTRQWDSLVNCRQDELGALDIEWHGGRRIDRIDPAAKCLIDESGRRHRYDRLVIATGSRPRVPADLPRAMQGIFTLRSRADADRIAGAAREAGAAVIIGGGLLGLETAAALRGLGMRVTVMQRSGRLMRRQLDATAAEILEEQLAEAGIEVILNDSIDRAIGGDRIHRVKTLAGRHLPCDVLVVAVGIQPNAEPGHAAGLEGAVGIRVDARMQSSDPDIFAIGEVAEFEGHCCGTTPAAQAQARVAAEAMTGDPLAAYEPCVESNILKIPGIRLATVGQTVVRETDGPAATAADGYESIQLLDRGAGYYKKCVLRHGRMVGAILVGDTAELATWRQLIESGLELEEIRETLLRPDGSTIEPCEGPQVCSCHNVGEGNIARTIEDGCDSLDELMTRCKAGTGCGSCRPAVERLWHERRERRMNVREIPRRKVSAG
jgi:ferredoxin-nitrate reductase